MTAMTLLRAMSDISPQDIEAALRAGSAERAAADSEAAAPERRGIGSAAGSGVPHAESPLIRLPLGGWLAAAACLVLTAGAILHFQQADSGLVLAPSVPDQIIEVTGTETTAVTAADTETTAADTAAHTTYTDTAADAVTVTVIGSGTAPEADAPPEQPPESVTAAPPSEPETQPPETTTAVTYAEYVPVLVAMADDAGLLTHEDGSAYTEGECAWEHITDRAAIGDYLGGEHPAVTVGSGQKSDSIAEQIMQNAAMLRIRWQMTDAKWESYGIQYAAIDRSGVLHLDVAVYSAGTPQPESDWICETALLYEAGTLPPVTAVDLQLVYFDDSDGGITEWLHYIASLLDDVDIHIE